MVTGRIPKEIWVIWKPITKVKSMDDFDDVYLDTCYTCGNTFLESRECECDENLDESEKIESWYD